MNNMIAAIDTFIDAATDMLNRPEYDILPEDDVRIINLYRSLVSMNIAKLSLLSNPVEVQS